MRRQNAAPSIGWQLAQCMVEVVRGRHNDNRNAPARASSVTAKTSPIETGANATYVREAEDIAHQRLDECDGRAEGCVGLANSPEQGLADTEVASDLVA